MKICIIGSGTMGNGIVQTFAAAGHDVVIKEIKETAIKAAMKNIDISLTRLADKGKITDSEKSDILKRIKSTISYEDIKDADIVIEAITENSNIKKSVFSELDQVCAPKTIFATNTSSLSITDIASATSRPDKVVGMHFFNPVPVMKLVEVIKGQLTSAETMQTIINLTNEIGKEPVIIEEAPGFIVNRILIPMINEAVGILAENVASREDIDKSMMLGANHPIGPLALADLIGIDVCLAIMETLCTEFSDPKYRPHPLLRKMARANLLGRKTSKGFYEYR